MIDVSIKQFLQELETILHACNDTSQSWMFRCINPGQPLARATTPWSPTSWQPRTEIFLMFGSCLASCLNPLSVTFAYVQRSQSSTAAGQRHHCRIRYGEATPQVKISDLIAVRGKLSQACFRNFRTLRHWQIPQWRSQFSKFTKAIVSYFGTIW